MCWYIPKPAKPPAKKQNTDSDRSGGGNCNNRDNIYYTYHEVVQRFGCTKYRRCIQCDKRNSCSRGEAEECRSYRKKRYSVLKRKYSCDCMGGICKLRKCEHYSSCNKKEKKCYEAWMKAYQKNNQEELEKLMKGSV